MAKITFIQPDGSAQTVDGESGMTVMETAKKHLIDGIEAECGGACACATCHVHVDDAWIERVGLPEEGSMESDLIQFAEGTTATSRLACQIPMATELDGLILHLPELQH